MSIKNQFNTVTPKNKFLQKYIAFYYFHSSDEMNRVDSYIYYPHYHNALSIYKDSTFCFLNSYSTLASPEPNKGYSMGYTKLLHHASKAEIRSPFDKIGVVFEPLGLNHFINCPLSELIKDQINLSFDYFRPGIEEVLDKVYSSRNFETKVQLLDAYFLDQFIGFSDEKLIKAVNILHSKEAKVSVEELASEVAVSRKTLLRSFKKHLNCTVKDYIKLIRFRKAVELYQKTTKLRSLTDLAHTTDYYDQSEFIKHFKKLTGFKPKLFFKNLSSIGKKGTYWTFDESK